MNSLLGLRVLVVEDEVVVALLIEDMLARLGCDVVASAARLRSAFDIASRTDFDFAVLDVNLQGEQSFPFARSLQERGVPFIFSTGYGAAGIPPDLADRAIVAKPFAITELERAIAATMERPDPSIGAP
ncbi:MAG: hypothetical protein JWR10_2192 [Rubritepida sp.]|nr:hypothetical protein [Rubritepida sp.]